MKNYLKKAFCVFFATLLTNAACIIFSFICYVFVDYTGGGYLSFLLFCIIFSLIVALFVKDID